MKKLLFSVLVLPAVQFATAQSACGNFDFEDQNYNGWAMYKGTNPSSTQAPASIIPYSAGSTSGLNTVAPYHALVNATNSNFLGVNFPSNYSGGTIARINHIGNGAEAAILERTFTVTSTQSTFNFSYIFFAEGASHTMADQAYLRIAVYDPNNQVIPSSTMQVAGMSGTSTTAGFMAVPGNPGWQYKPWTPVTYNFSQYVGQVLKIQFIAADCTAGGHGGHAYIDFDCNTSSSGIPNVWPGDANYDLTADFLDLFYVGAASGFTGTSRSSAGTTWTAAASADWNINSLYLVDAKHADCDGNGIVNSTDATAITTNYGLSHPFKMMQPNQVVLKSSTVYPLKIVPDKNSISVDESLKLDFMIGNSQTAIDSIFAIGFTLTYPDNLFQSSQTTFDCASSVIGNISTNLLSLSHKDNGTMDLAVCRNNRTNVNAVVNGKIFSLNLKTKADITVPSTMTFSISNIKALDRSGRQLNMDMTSENVQLTIPVDVTGLRDNFLSQILIGPNPVNDVLTYSMPVEVSGTYVVYSLVGKNVSNGEFTGARNGGINTSAFQNGIYFIKFESAAGTTVTKKFIKAGLD